LSPYDVGILLAWNYLDVGPAPHEFLDEARVVALIHEYFYLFQSLEVNIGNSIIDQDLLEEVVLLRLLFL
jgi:hypothetical protein